MTSSFKKENLPPEMDPEGNARKRVCKACDRCRLKKSKCDGSSPCNRCQSDNAICVFGERKKSHDKVYPKGYVEMLEQDREKLVNATREMYNRLEANEPWPGPPLHRPNGFPLVHDILERLGLLHLGTGDYEEIFEESTEALRKQMMSTQVPTEEEIPYPTPATTQSDFSPPESDFIPESDYMELYSSHTLRSDGTLSTDPYQHTLSTIPTNEQIPYMHESQNMAVTSQLGDGVSYSLYQTPSYAVMNPHNYNVTSPYGLGLMQPSGSPYLPTYNDDFGDPSTGDPST